jgi:23S rRNA (uridine2552-2'-O)-methyltransferase
MAKKVKGPNKGSGKGSGKGSKGNQWADHLTQRAKAENYPARSVYKLEEIQKKFKVIMSGSQVLDLGCAPGSWLLYAAKQVGSQGRVFGRMT